MPAKTLLSVLFLISLGVIAMLYLRALSHSVDAGNPQAMNGVLVATASLAPGTLLRAQDVAWKPVAAPVKPDQIVRPSAEARGVKPELDEQARAEAYGAALRARVAAGDPIQRSVIVKPGDRDFLQIVLAPGLRAVVIPVAAGGASTGLLYPGDRVDVILTQAFKMDVPLVRRSVSETVVENLRVLTVTASNGKAGDPGRGSAQTVTLEVTPEQAEEINVATELGKLSLTLRGVEITDTVTATSTPGPGKPTGIKATWAGDVSQALFDALPREKAVASATPAVEIIRGTKREAVKPH